MNDSTNTPPTPPPARPTPPDGHRPGFKKTPLGWVPVEWEVRTIGDTAKVTSGGTPDRKRSEYWNGNIPWITTSLIDFNEIEQAKEFITLEGLRNSSTKIFEPGTILLALYGQGKTRGKVGVLKIQATINQACAAIIPKNIVDVRFFFQYLCKSYKALRNLSNTGNQENLSGELVKSFLIPLPPLPEQRRIAAILGAWDRAIELTQELLRAKESQKKGLMQRLLSGKVRVRGAEGAWREVIFGDLGTPFRGLAGKNKEDFGEGKPYIPYLNVFNNDRIDALDLDFVKVGANETQNRVIYGDLLFTVSSETPDEVGMSSVLLDELGEVYLNSFCFGFRLNSFDVLHPDFARFLFRGAEIRKKISALAQGSTRYNLSKNQMMKMCLELPIVEEQAAIARILCAADAEIGLLRAQAAQLQEQKRGLMQQLLTGKTRVKP